MTEDWLILRTYHEDWTTADFEDAVREALRSHGIDELVDIEVSEK